MDKELQRQIDEARANGYSEEQIQAFLNPQPVKETALQPAAGPMGKTTVQTPATPWVDRGPEDTATIQAGALDLGYNMAKYGLPAAGLGYALKKGMDTYKQTRMPPPQTFTGGANPAFDRALSQPFNPAAPQGAPAAAAPQQPPIGGPAAQQATTFIQRMQALATQYAPAARALTGVGAMLYSPSLNANEAEELRKIRGY
jgi:hypothetical protein